VAEPQTYPPVSLRAARDEHLCFVPALLTVSDWQAPRWIIRAAVLPTAVRLARVAGLAEQFRVKKRRRNRREVGKSRGRKIVGKSNERKSGRGFCLSKNALDMQSCAPWQRAMLLF
jgi:hypothetical protein